MMPHTESTDQTSSTASALTMYEGRITEACKPLSLTSAQTVHSPSNLDSAYGPTGRHGCRSSTGWYAHASTCESFGYTDEELTWTRRRSLSACAAQAFA